MQAPAEAPDLVIARLLDYWGSRTGWQRRLWNPSSLTLLKETLETASEVDGGHLRDSALRHLANSARSQCRQDSGIGSCALRSAIDKTLEEVAKNPSAWHQLEYLISESPSTYVANWRDAFEEKPGILPTELVSRRVGAHLLDLGHSPEALHRWATWLRSDSMPETVADLLDAASSVAERKARRWEVFVPFSALARHKQTMPDQWLEPTKASAWLSQYGGQHGAIRHNGGFLFHIDALDQWAAVEVVADQIESLSARVSVGLPGSPAFKPSTHAVVLGSQRLITLERPRRQVDVHSLHRQDLLFAISKQGLAGRLRSAIDLVAPLETGAPGAAVAGGWAAIEAALARPGTPNVDLSSDMAALITCSLPRAELTPLVYAYIKENDDPLAEALYSAQSNRAKCALLLNAIADGSPVSYKHPSDTAALARIRVIIAEPGATLGRIHGYVDSALKRLYRQRNLVLHAGRTDSVGMIPALRAAPPLVGAGLDRLVHDAAVTSDFDGTRLVARAHAELKMLGKSQGRRVVDLLGA